MLDFDSHSVSKDFSGSCIVVRAYDQCVISTYQHSVIWSHWIIT